MCHVVLPGDPGIAPGTHLCYGEQGQRRPAVRARGHARVPRPPHLTGGSLTVLPVPLRQSP